MKAKANLLTIIIFFGAVWGILEATLGYALQFLPPLFSGSVMFPIGAMILIYAYKHTESRKAIFYVALIAATIKGINLFLPGLPPIKTYNPMIAIMLQSLVMIAFIRVVDMKHVPIKLVGFVTVSIAWRVLFLMNNTINHALSGFPFQHMLTVQSLLDFALVLGLMGAVILAALYYATHYLLNHVRLTWKPNPAIAWSMVVAALVLTWFL